MRSNILEERPSFQFQQLLSALTLVEHLLRESVCVMILTQLNLGSDYQNHKLIESFINEQEITLKKCLSIH